MPDGALVIVIDGTREDWPGGPRTLTPLDPDLEPNRRTCWFGTSLTPAGPQVWFRITGEVVRRMPETTPGARGHRLVDVLLAWLSDHKTHERLYPQRGFCEVRGLIRQPFHCLKYRPTEPLVGSLFDAAPERRWRLPPPLSWRETRPGRSALAPETMLYAYNCMRVSAY